MSNVINLFGDEEAGSNKEDTRTAEQRIEDYKIKVLYSLKYFHTFTPTQKYELYDGIVEFSFSCVDKLLANFNGKG